MVAPSPLFYFAGILLVALLGLAGRTFLVGVREQVVKTVVNTAVDALLNDVKTSINDIKLSVQDIKDDVKLMKTSQATQTQATLLTSTELSAMRTRIDEHTTSDEKWQDTERTFREKVQDFMDWASEFLRSHVHAGAIASSSDKNGLVSS